MAEQKEKMIRVRMLETRRAAPDGIHVQLYEVGQSYEVPPDLARAWFASGRAEEDKMIQGPPETKRRRR